MERMHMNVNRLAYLFLGALIAAHASAQQSEEAAAQGGERAERAETTQASDAGDRDAGASLWIAHGESDNIRRSADETRGSYNAAGVLVDAHRARERLTAGLETDLQYRRYSLPDLEDETLGALEAFADVAIVREKFDWTFGDSFGQGRTDPFSAVGPENRENINIFTTGPEVDLPLGPRTSMSLDALYGDRTYEDTKTLDATSMAYELGVFRETGPVNRIGLFVSNNDVEYDVGTLSYDIVSAGVRYERTLATGEVLAEVGRNELRMNGTTEDGPRLNFAWRRGIGAHSRLSLSATREFTDSSAMFALTAEAPPSVSDPENAVLAPDAMEQKRIELFYELEGAKSRMSIGLAANEDRFRLDPTLDNDSASARLELERRIGTRLTIGIAAENVRRDFVDRLGEDGERLTEFTLDHRIGRRLTFEAIAGTYSRRAADSFDETRYQVGLSFRPAR
jgi:hypothetical protein